MEIKTDPNQKRVPDHSKRQMLKDRPNCNFSREPNNSTLWRAAHRIKPYKSGAGHVSDTTEVFTPAPYQVHSTSPDPGSLPASHRQQGDSRNKNSKREWCQAGDSLTFFFLFTKWCHLSSPFHHLCDAPLRGHAQLPDDHGVRTWTHSRVFHSYGKKWSDRSMK